MFVCACVDAAAVRTHNQARLAKATTEADFEMLSVIETAAKRASEATDRIRRLDDDLARLRKDVR